MLINSHICYVVHIMIVWQFLGYCDCLWLFVSGDCLFTYCRVQLWWLQCGPHTKHGCNEWRILLRWYDCQWKWLYKYHIFRSISRGFLKKFHGSGLYSGAAYVQTFPKNHALHTACCGVPRSALDHNQLTLSTPQSLTVSAAVWPPLPRPPSLSLCLCMRGVSFQWQSTALQYVAAVYCTHQQSVGKLLPEVPCWAHSSGPQVAVVISRSARLNASRVDHVLPLFCQSSCHHMYGSFLRARK